MIEVTNSFKNKIFDTVRTVKGAVQFEILDVSAYEDATITISGESEISRNKQTINQKRTMTNKYATFEPDYFKLDGSFYIPPKRTEGGSELGWWSDVLADSTGAFLTPPTVEYTFSQPHTSMGLMVTFDKLANEYASDFTIDIFDGSGVLVTSKTITGHTSPEYILDQNLENYQRILITIQKWANPNRRARIVEVDFGVVEEYTGDKLISVRTIEETDLLASLVPSDEMEFVLDNSDNRFNILNPNGVYGFLKVNQPMTAQLGLEIDENSYEYVPLGRYYLDEWKVEEGGMTATFTGRDIFTKLDAIDYTRLLQNTNLYDLAVDVLAQAKIKDYKIDEALKTISTTGFKEKLKAREALQLIAIAGKSVIRQNRFGTVLIEQIEELTYDTGYITFASDSTFTGMVTPTVSQDYQFQAITFENAFDAPQVKLAPAITHLVFNVYTSTGEVKYTFTNPKVTEGQGFEIDNPLINTQAHAEEVANWQFREYNLIAEYQANWRQNPALECVDIISIEDSFGSKKKARITKQEINYSGYLNGTTEAKGGI